MTEEIGKRFGDINSLPPEIRGQLVRRKNLTSIPEMVIEILGKFGGKATVDEIYVELWRRTKYSKPKKNLAGTIGCMAHIGRVKRVPEIVGCYALPQK